MQAPALDVGHLIIYRASRLEALVPPLRAVIAAAPPAALLAPVQVVAGHAGVRNWLGMALARAAGPGGISANLDIQLPSSWLERLAREALGESAVALAPYDQAVLRWRIHGLLPDAPSPRVRAYLSGEDGARRRLQLADHLAALFTRYTIYRRDWLAAWARGERALPGDEEAASPLPWLWQRLRVQVGQPHRGERLRQLAEALAGPGPIGATQSRDDALHLFGLNHVAPDELAVFAALSRHRPVVLYLADPCRLDWFELRGQRQRLRAALESGVEPDMAFLDQDHPLLASWGRLGQDFLLALEGLEAGIDVRHWQDEQDTPPRNRLSRLQEGIRRLQPDLLRPAADDDLRGDASLRVHACHTRVRELEVLRDVLLRARVDDATLEPGEIVVMAPDIQAYLPLLPAIFGRPGEAGSALPYHLADVAVAQAHPLLQAFARLLDLPGARLTATEVGELLQVPQVAARFGLAPGGAVRVADWLRQLRVAWGLDAGHRARLDVPAIEAHTLAWGVDRLLASHVFGDHAGETVALPDGAELVPLAGIEGPQAADLGALDALLVQVRGWQEDASRARPASDWSQRLERRLDGLFRVAGDDRPGQDALAILRRLVRSLRDQTAQAGVDPELAYAEVRDLLRQGLQMPLERQPFLLGGVTFCGMVPQRAIPFRVVAVLGLNEGEFPRTGMDAGLDLMPGHPRPGDRDLRFDDRYLFLETVMSARDRLHLSFIGEGAGDGARRNPAAPLAELLAELDRVHGVPPTANGKEADAARPWLVRHPLQPFDRRYFDGSDPALFSHRASFAAMAGAAGPTDATLPPFATLGAAPLDDAAVPDPEPVELAQVLGYFRDPARHLLRDGLGLRLEEVDQDDGREPLEARLPPRHRVPHRLLREALRGQAGPLPEAMPAWLAHSGLLALGVAGQQAWERMRAEVDPLLRELGALALFASGWPRPWPRPGAPVILGGWALQGAFPDAWRHGGSPWVLDLQPGRERAKRHLGQRLGVFLQWATLRLDPAHAHAAIPLTVVAKDGVVADLHEAWNRRWLESAAGREALGADLAARAGRLLALYRQARAAPLAYFPATSAAAGGPEDAQEAWAGGHARTGERDYAPGFARLLAGDAPFHDSAQYEALHRLALALEALLAVDDSMGDAP